MLRRVLFFLMLQVSPYFAKGVIQIQEIRLFTGFIGARAQVKLVELLELILV